MNIILKHYVKDKNLMLRKYSMSKARTIAEYIIRVYLVVNTKLIVDLLQSKI